MVDARGSGVKKFAKADDSVEAFETLVLLKKEVISALQNEYEHAQRECSAINQYSSPCPLGRPDGTASGNAALYGDSYACHGNERSRSLDTDSGSCRNDALVKWESPEFQSLERRWNAQLQECIQCVKMDMSYSRPNSVSAEEIDAIQQSIEKLKSAYFRAVKEREDSNKLWLRLKMYSNTRKEALEDICKPYCSAKETPEPVDTKRMFSRGPMANPYRTIETLKTSSEIQPPFIQGVMSRDNEDTTTPGSSQTPSIEKIAQRGVQQTNGAGYQMACNSAIDEFLSQTDSTEIFLKTAENIYIQYGDGCMSLKTFNNIADFLVHSLNIPAIDGAPVTRLLRLYGIGNGAIIDRETFIMLYWEVAHVVRRALDVMQCVNLTGLHVQGQPGQEQCSNFVKISNIFEFRKKLYSGYSCSKFLATEIETGEMRVIDIITKTDKVPPFELIALEVARLAQLQRQHLALYLDAYQDANSIYVVSEFCRGGSLLHHISNKSEREYTTGFVQVVMSQVIEALLYLHCNNLVHGSITIDKVMMQDHEYNQVKIRDTGLRGLLDTVVGGSALTMMHVAPEARDGQVTHKSDVWSVGVILAFLVTGIAPDEHMDYVQYARAVERHLDRGVIFRRDDNLTDLVRKMICVDPNSRPTAFEIISHPWYATSGRSANVPGYFRSLIRPINRLNALKRMYLDIISVLESQSSLFVCRIHKLMDTMQLGKRLRRGKAMIKDLKMALRVEGLPRQTIDNIMVLMLSESEANAVQHFMNALARWKNGEIALAWSEFDSSPHGDRCSMDIAQFTRFLANTPGRLIPMEETKRVTNALAVEERVRWSDFVSYLR
ncbi:protein kinase domain containing protein, putative [Babesia bigemina]|uniref:Protein kinase domain containing protein, putative n=1 Tax=Babesia bigemina TaxID=5866 RepID=A0A061D4C1_BABBI|nr:protein kinase domain containing protein, putative [Babesia bigemina]CDR94897.1 protein kinase domain containing protein, putative [Babesia bigemina]|eukprot:XP_012767083.1 protein kinase domain containing protein, putative [Babesia bigemina]